jgi:hypothetical protein
MKRYTSFPKKDPLLCFSIACFVLIFPIIFWTDVDSADAIEEPSTVSEIEGLIMEFNKGMLSVDIEDVDAKMVLKALAEKGEIEIINQKILPSRKVTIKFKNLKEEEGGIEELMRVTGITNYVAIYEKGVELKKSKIAKLILVKAAPSGTSVTEVKKNEVEITAPVEKKREDIGKAMDKAQAEAIMEAIMPMLEAEGDGETAREIMKELMEGETHPIDE